MSYTTRITSDFSPHINTTAEEMKQWLDIVPDEAKIKTIVTPGDRYYDRAQVTLKAQWEIEL